MKETHRTATIFAGIYTLIQAIIWGVISIYSVAIYACQANFPYPVDSFRLTISDLLYVSYYLGTCREHPDMLQVEAPSATRTYYWMLIYGVVSAVWIPTSVLLLVACVSRIYGRYGACLYLPWLINTALFIVMDLCATIIYGIDISKTMTVKDYEEFIKPMPMLAMGAEGITVVPAIEMTAFFSRAIIFWLLNFILLGVVIQGTRAVCQYSTASAFVQNEVRMRTNDHGASSQWVNVKSEDINMKRLPRLRIEEDDSPTRIRAPHAPISPQSPMSEVVPTPLVPILKLPPVPANPPPVDRGQSYSRDGNSSPVYDVYGKHLGNAFPEEIHKHIPTNDAALKSGLSNQVPWSYAAAGELNQRIKLAALQHAEAEKPNQPKPDYTMHYPRGKRPELASHEGDWYEYNSNSTLYNGSPYSELNQRQIGGFYKK